MFRRKRKTSDFNAEIEAHLQQESERLREQGLSEEDAHAAAHRAFGNVMQAEERHYESGRWMWWDHLQQDLRFGVRVLWRNPGFAAVAVVTLALGIAVNATMFSMVSAFVLRRPPGRDPERMVVVSSVNPVEGFQADANPVSAPNYLAWREASSVFTEVAAADQFRPVSLMTQKQPEALHAAAISPNYFNVFGVLPQMGRTFANGEDQPGHDHVVILSHELWERRFGSDPSILWHTVRLNREDYDVVGVMPANFQMLGYTAQLWIPLTLSRANQTASAHNDRSLFMIARLKRGVTLEQARAEIATLGRRAEEMFPESEKGWGVIVRTLPDFLLYSFQIREALAVLMTTVGFVLMIACANVAGLLLARATRRRKELAVRISLGAKRLRIARQLLTEGLVIALLGGCLGMLLAYWGIHAVQANMTFNEAISAVPFRLDRNVLFFSLAVSLLCAVLCGIAPAWNAARTDINTHLKDESRAVSAGQSQNRLRTILVTGEIALALVLLIGTGLLIHGIALIENQELGFQSEPLLTARLSLDDARYKSGAKQIEFVRDVVQRIEQIPGAEAVAVASDIPATGAGSVTLRMKGEPELPANQRSSAVDFVVSTDFFRTAGVPVLRGRTFLETDSDKAPHVVVVNEEFVRRNLKGQEPLGKQIVLDLSGAPAQWSEIVGVVGNVKTYSDEVRDYPEVYEAFLQRPVSSLGLMVRAGSDPNSLASALRDAVSQVDSELPLSSVMSMHTVIENQKGGNPFFTRVLVSFALLALILAAIGIYGLVSYSVGQRKHEIGIRMAMGARNGDVLRIVLWQGAKTTLIGATIGLLMALPLPTIFNSLFSGLINVSEPRLYFVVPLAISLVTMLATYIPARRALSVDPMVTLRHE